MTAQHLSANLRLLSHRELSAANDRHRSKSVETPASSTRPDARPPGEERIRNGGRHRCQPPLSGLAPVATIRFIPVRCSCDQQPAKRCVFARAVAARRRFGRPPFGGRPHLENSSSSLLASAEAIAVQAMGCLPVLDRVRLNSWESLRSVIKLSFDFLVSPIRSLPASLATTLNVPAGRRLCRPMIGS